MDAELERILGRDPARCANLRNFAERYGLSGRLIVGDSVLARGASDREWAYLLPADVPEGESLIASLTPADRHIVGFDGWALERVRELYDVEWVLACRKLTWPGGRRPEAPGAPVRALARADAPFIQANSDYGEFTSVPYIEERIGEVAAGGIDAEDGRLAAWVLTHDDGAIGFLHVREPFRRRGYGAALLRWAVGEVLAAGGLPFVHVEPGNRASLALMEKVGFEPAGEVWWLAGTMKGGR